MRGNFCSTAEQSQGSQNEFKRGIWIDYGDCTLDAAGNPKSPPVVNSAAAGRTAKSLSASRQRFDILFSIIVVMHLKPDLFGTAIALSVGMKQIIIFLTTLMMLSGCGSNSESHSTPIQRAQFIYVLNTGEETISQFKVGISGELIQLATPKVQTGGLPKGMVMDATHNYMYVSSSSDDNISQFAIGSDGSLTALASPIATGSFPHALVLSPDGRFVYSMNLQGETITQYLIGTDGQLSLSSTTSHPEGPMNMTFAPSGNFSYVINGMDSTISQYAVGSDGTLSALTPASVSSAGCPSGPLSSKKASGGGEYLYVLSCSTNEIEVFAIGMGGTLTSQAVVATGLSPQGMSISGSNIYVANGQDATVSMFSIEADGSLQAIPQATSAAGSSPETLMIDVLSKTAYVIDYYNDEVSQYSISADGSLQSVNTPVSVGNTPTIILSKP